MYNKNMIKYRSKKKTTKSQLIFLCILFIVVVVQNSSDLLSKLGLVKNDTSIVTLIKCIDGDTATFNVDGTNHKVRFISIDTPELSSDDYYAQEALDYTCDRLSSGEITLEFDPNSDKFDKYNRMIAWVYVDDALLQKELVEKGFAQVKYVYGDYKYVDELYEVQTLAKKSKVGIWR